MVSTMKFGLANDSLPYAPPSLMLCLLYTRSCSVTKYDLSLNKARFYQDSKSGIPHPNSLTAGHCIYRKTNSEIDFVLFHHSTKFYWWRWKSFYPKYTLNIINLNFNEFLFFNFRFPVIKKFSIVFLSIKTIYLFNIKTWSSFIIQTHKFACIA